MADQPSLTIDAKAFYASLSDRGKCVLAFVIDRESIGHVTAQLPLLRNAAACRLSVEPAPDGWSAPGAPEVPVYVEPAIPLTEEGIVGLEAQVKRKALLRADRILEQGTTEEQLRIISSLAQMKAMHVETEDSELVSMRVEFDKMMRGMSGESSGSESGPAS